MKYITRHADGHRRGLWLLAAGAALAGAALVVRKHTREAERDNPPAGQFIDVDGVRLHYVEQGEGRPLVLLHGEGGMIQDFVSSGLIDLAAANYRVIVFDRPGHGYSQRPRTTIWTPQAQARLLHKALRRLGVEQPIVVAHSWGTLVALALALDFPDDVQSLVLLSGYYYPVPRADVLLLSPPAIPIVGDLLRYTISPLIGRALWPAMLHRMFGPAPIPQRYAAEYPVWMTLRPSQLRASAAESLLMIPAAFSLQHRYHELTMPVVIMAGEHDHHADYHAHSERLHRELPHSTLHLTAGGGHMLHHVEQHEVMAAIDQAAHAVGAERRHVGTPISPAPALLS
ncbi:MAG: alpha/beta fold hydrolase [Noviherbaspirillum sp.]